MWEEEWAAQDLGNHVPHDGFVPRDDDWASPEKRKRDEEEDEEEEKKKVAVDAAAISAERVAAAVEVWEENLRAMKKPSYKDRIAADDKKSGLV
ncbi:unnamed protein product [Fusarium langsethiae]|nr:unnamed protein product [Fusarium langsethiae]